MISSKYNLVLAVYPNSKGFAFVIFEGSLSAIDWGVKDVRGTERNRKCLRQVEHIINRYHPNVVVLQDTSETGTRRARRVRNLNAEIAELVESHGQTTRLYSRSQTKAIFGHLGNATKEQIARDIARHIPALERYLPPVRKPWMSEDARMGLFDAAALAMTFFRSEANRRAA